MTESEKLAYSKAVEEIEGDSFVQHSFKSSSSDKKSQSSANDQGDETFNFGTQAEVTAKGGGKFIPLSDDSLFSPHVCMGLAQLMVYDVMFSLLFLLVFFWQFNM